MRNVINYTIRNKSLSYRVEKNQDTGKPEIIIDGWQDGIAASPYEGITSLKNLNIRYLPGAVYSNYKRILNTAANNIGIPKYWTKDPTTGAYYIIDSNGRVWTTSDPATVAWTRLAGNDANLGGGQGICVYKGYVFVFRDSVIDYYNIAGAAWTFAWKTGLQAGVNHMSIWGQDDIMYFCNGSPLTTTKAGSSIGSLATTVGSTFNPATAGTYTYNTIALTLPGFEQSATWLAELQVDLMVAAGKNLYPWDRSATNFNGIPVPMRETIVRVINILNKLYITAGVKGNIYISNGYSTSPWVKIPDSFFGIIDPQLLPGDMMSHRNKLYVGFSCGNSPFANGVFSIDLDTKIINFENQNSYGLNASGVNSLFGQPGVLIEIETASFDCYASAWYDGSVGGMDKNSTTLYTGGETIIETDLIPIGTYLYPSTQMNIEFKLDQPMASSDSITIYGRQSFSDNYTQLGTTTGAVLSAVYTPLALQKSQWMQYKIVLTQSSTTFIRLREIRIRQ